MIACNLTTGLVVPPTYLSRHSEISNEFNKFLSNTSSIPKGN